MAKVDYLCFLYLLKRGSIQHASRKLVEFDYEVIDLDVISMDAACIAIIQTVKNNTGRYPTDLLIGSDEARRLWQHMRSTPQLSVQADIEFMDHGRPTYRGMNIHIFPWMSGMIALHLDMF